MNSYYPQLPKALITLLLLLLVACSPSDQPDATTSVEVESAPAIETKVDDLEASVARMAAIGYSFGGSFPPDGKQIVSIGKTNTIFA